ncbi:hypothetical protein C8Q76DRAFT_791940 [Neofusicoccum parvum]|nr:hypothetical protein C8Q76DRAFT_791940 [Neofusicoccum parvum]
MVKPKILFLTCPEHGQANVHLAVIASLREHHNDDVDIYISSYESLRPRVPDGVTFKPVFGHGLIHYFKPTLEEGMTVRNTFRYVWTAPGFFNTITAVTKMLTVIHSETPEEYVKTAQAIEEVIDELDPTLVVIDSMFAQARDAAKKKGQAQVVLSPNVLKDLTMPDQGWRIFTFPV